MRLRDLAGRPLGRSDLVPGVPQTCLERYRVHVPVLHHAFPPPRASETITSASIPSAWSRDWRNIVQVARSGHHPSICLIRNIVGSVGNASKGRTRARPEPNTTIQHHQHSSQAAPYGGFLDWTAHGPEAPS